MDNKSIADKVEEFLFDHTFCTVNPKNTSEEIPVIKAEDAGELVTMILTFVNESIAKIWDH